LAKAKTSRTPSAWQQHGIWLALLGLLVVTALGSPLFSTQTVLSDRGTDLSAQFLYARAFGFGEMARGRLPLWNPYIYGGVPFLGDFQSALLYPPNLIFLILPLATALNWSFALHLFLLAAAMYFWAVLRGQRPAAAFVAGAAAMFSGTVLLHIYAGHLSNICSMAWIPLVFAGIDGWLKRRHAVWPALSAVAVALQIYAGHPQYVYYTALVAGLYSLLHLPGTPRPVSAVVGLLAIYPAAALLGAAQLLPGLAAASEAVRSGRAVYEFAAMFSFPPENFLTLAGPWLFGDMREAPYWGRCYLWEMCVYGGVGMLVLAVFGAGRKTANFGRLRLFLLLGAVILLALGAHTPLHRLLYEWLPGFGSFRGSSKFIIFAGLILALLAGTGMDRLLRGERGSWILVGSLAALGILLLAAGTQISAERLTNFAQAVNATGESYFPPAALEQPELRETLRRTLAHALQISGGLFAGFALLLAAAWRRSAATWILGAAAVGELLVFARGTVATFPLEYFLFRPVANALQEHLGKYPGDERVINLFSPDSGMILKAENIWGYDPGVLKRYAQLLFVSQDQDPENAGQNLPITRAHPILSLLRTRLAFVPKPGGNIDIVTFQDPFPRFALYSQYRVVPDPNRRLSELKNVTFDFRKEVLLEEEPVPAPDPESSPHEISVLDSSTDHWTLQVRTGRAAILLMTDSYSKDWRVEALPGSVQTRYTLLPANHALRAVPLAAGEHRLRLVYSPRGWKTGLLITGLSLTALAAVFLHPALRRRLDFT
jgi:Predicted integral membrane protein